jgi:hypothetical protein
MILRSRKNSLQMANDFLQAAAVFAALLGFVLNPKEWPRHWNGAKPVRTELLDERTSLHFENGGSRPVMPDVIH